MLDWSPDGAPRSRRFDDVYFSTEGGLDEARAVFLAGCGLPDAWRGRPRFVVGELGFGTGLNILALLELWRRARPAGGRLDIFSIEAFPLSREDAARALGAWPERADLAGTLIRRWPTAEGFHRIDFPGLDARLDLAVMEAAEALAAWDGRADAWFLDGFSPAKNPEMWREEVLALLAQRSAPGARAASFTIAGAGEGLGVQPGHDPAAGVEPRRDQGRRIARGGDRGVRDHQRAQPLRLAGPGEGGAGDARSDDADARRRPMGRRGRLDQPRLQPFGLASEAGAALD